MSLALHQFLALYMWFPLAALLVFMLLIARFYQKFSGERTYFEWFLVPLVCFGGWAVRYASIDQIAGNVLADFFLGMGGVFWLILSLRLYWLMIYRRQDR